MYIYSRDITFNILAYKLEKFKVRIWLVKSSGTCRVRELAQLVGTLQSVRLATGQSLSVMTLSLYLAVVKAASWSSFMVLDWLATFEVRWQLEEIDSVAQYPMQGSLSTTPVTYEVASDASGVGHFCYHVAGGRMMLEARASQGEG